MTSVRPSPPELVLIGAVVLPDRVVSDGAVVLTGDRISYVGRRDDPAVPHHAARADLPSGTFLLPGLVDLHCHGAAGGEFGADEASARRAADHHHRAGTTSIVASLVSASPSVMDAGMRVCAVLATEGALLGVHTEGPFLAQARRGAQDPEALAGVDLRLVDALARAGGGKWSAMTFAPEKSGAEALIQRLADHDVLPAIGHTDADAAVTARALALAQQALPHRRPLVTHLFNGMRPLHHRDPGPVAPSLAAAARGKAVIELIADGVHLADATVSMVMDVAAPGSVALVSDAMAGTGMPDGRYTLGRLDVVVAGGTVRLAEGDSIAGGVGTLLDVVRRCVQHARIPLVDAVRAASATPATALGMSGEIGTLATGLRGDVLAVDDALRPLAVWRAGRRLQPVGTEEITS